MNSLEIANIINLLSLTLLNIEGNSTQYQELRKKLLDKIEELLKRV